MNKTQSLREVTLSEIKKEIIFDEQIINLTRETINQEFVKMGMNGNDRRKTQIKLNNPFELPHKTC